MKQKLLVSTKKRGDAKGIGIEATHAMRCYTQQINLLYPGSDRTVVCMGSV